MKKPFKFFSKKSGKEGSAREERAESKAERRREAKNPKLEAREEKRFGKKR